MKRNRNNKGFSYVEMIVVLGIMSIMTAFIALTLGTVNRNNVRRASESIQSKMNEARVSAMSKGTQRGYLMIARYNNNIYTYVGQGIDPTTGELYTAEAISKRGEKLCSPKLNITVAGQEMNGDVGNVVYLQFKQSTGGLNNCSGTISGNQVTVKVANDKDTTVSSFKIFTQSGKIKSE